MRMNGKKSILRHISESVGQSWLKLQVNSPWPTGYYTPYPFADSSSNSSLSLLHNHLFLFYWTFTSAYSMFFFLPNIFKKFFSPLFAWLATTIFPCSLCRKGPWNNYYSRPISISLNYLFQLSNQVCASQPKFLLQGYMAKSSAKFPISIILYYQ